MIERRRHVNVTRRNVIKRDRISLIAPRRSAALFHPHREGSIFFPAARLVRRLCVFTHEHIVCRSLRFERRRSIVNSVRRTLYSLA